MAFPIPGGTPAPVNRKAPAMGGGKGLPAPKKKKKKLGKPGGMSIGLPSLPGAPMPPQPMM